MISEARHYSLVLSFVDNHTIITIPLISNLDIVRYTFLLVNWIHIGVLYLLITCVNIRLGMGHVIKKIVHKNIQQRRFRDILT